LHGVAQIVVDRGQVGQQRAAGYQAGQAEAWQQQQQREAQQAETDGVLDLRPARFGQGY